MTWQAWLMRNITEQTEQARKLSKRTVKDFDQEHSVSTSRDNYGWRSMMKGTSFLGDGKDGRGRK